MTPSSAGPQVAGASRSKRRSALTIVATLGGHASIRRDDTGATTALADGDITLIKGGPYTIADYPATPAQVLIRGGRKLVVGGHDAAAWDSRRLAPRTYGDGLPEATIMLRGAFDLRGTVAEHLLDILPPIAVVPAGPRTRPALDLLSAETARDEPGQDAVLHRLLDLVLVVALRAWYAGPQTTPPTFYRALADPVTGHALRLLHEAPEHRWTVAELAAEVDLSRAAFAARFSKLVGKPPLTYLTDWRMTLAAARRPGAPRDRWMPCARTAWPRWCPGRVSSEASVLGGDHGAPFPMTAPSRGVTEPKGDRMSRTDKTRPEWVKLAERPMVTCRPEHDHRFGPCTLPDRVDADAMSAPRPVRGCHWVVTDHFASTVGNDGCRGCTNYYGRRWDRRRSRHEARRELRDYHDED